MAEKKIEAEQDEDEFFTVRLAPECRRYVPGPKEKHGEVLVNWIKGYTKARTASRLNKKDVYTWVFKHQEDADKFDQTWNDRKKPEADGGEDD